MENKSHSLYQLIKNSPDNMKEEFLNCLEGMMNSTRVSIKQEFDFISKKNPVNDDDYGPESYVVKFYETVSPIKLVH